MPYSLAHSARCTLVALCVCAFLAMGVPFAAYAALPPEPLADVYVSVTGNNATGDGSEALPFRTITWGLTRVDEMGTVHVLPGVYHDSEVFPLVVPGRVMVESTGGMWATTIQGDNTNSVVRMRHPLGHTGISGFTITSGRSLLGGGIEMVADSVDTPDSMWPQVTNCYIRNNVSTGVGGGLYYMGNATKVLSPRIADCIIADNSAASGGGGIGVGDYTWGSFDNCQIRGNDAESGAKGGNVYLWNSGASFYWSDISNGSADFGGNVWIGGSDMSEFVMSSIHGGYAALDGGGISIDKNAGSTMFRGIRIYDNEAERAGGGVKVTSIVDSTANTFVNCLITDNHATAAGSMGGAMFINSETDDTLSIDSCTIANNEAVLSMDGVGVIDGDGVHSVEVTIRNSVFWHRQRTPGDSTSVQDYYSFNPADDTISYSLFRNPNWLGTGVVHGDPLFVDPVDGDYHVKKGSPAIDSGTVLPWPSTLDLDTEPRPLDGDSSGVAQFDMGCFEHAPFEADRLAGVTRYETACEVARRGFYGTSMAVLANGAGFADALSAAGLAGAVEGPVLLVKQSSVPQIVIDTLHSLAVHQVIIVGGEDVVAPAVVTALETEGFEVRRVSGATRYETSAEVAREIARRQGDIFGKWGFIVRGDAFPDALAVGPLAYARKMPVLLVKPTSLPTAISDVIAETSICDLTVAGGESAVSSGVYDLLDALPSTCSIERVYGSDRYATAAEIAEAGIDYGWVSANYVGIATGLNFPDALAGGPAAGNRGGVLLLCKTASLPAAPTTFLTAHKDEVTRADIFGGSDVVGPAVQQAIEDALDW